ncbi:secretory carrier-associated membrane protein 3 isoform X3 [Mirounga angustirostris]|uniref:secretory carrier-associated membrane protein 3 isoform X3 n=1 Tax=Mirounga angustirostris TaxID=9716 RepID=UPI00313CDDDF
MAQSGDGGNPFAGPGELDNPFQDPAVIQHRPSPQYATLDVYNPFETREPPPAYEPPAPAPLPPPSAPSLQSSRKLSPAEPKNYGSYSTQDISMEIPQEFQKTVSTMYYLWMCSTLALLLNFLACLASFCVETSNGSGFGLSILWVLLFTPCSFVCWYRPMYKAFRSDSSFNFFIFFFIFFVQDVLFVLQAIGIPGWGFRSTPCTVARGPAFRRPSKNLPLGSSPTPPCEPPLPTQPLGLPKMPSEPRDPRRGCPGPAAGGAHLAPVPDVSDSVRPHYSGSSLWRPQSRSHDC